MKKTAFALLGLVCFAVMWRCSADAREERPAASLAQKASVEDLRRAYAEAKTMEARRAVYLRAIDEGVFAERGSIEIVDRIFGFDDKGAPGRWILENYPWKETETKEKVSPPQWGSLRVADLGSPAKSSDSSSHLYLVAAPHGRDLIVSELCDCQYMPRWKTIWHPPATESEPYVPQKDAASGESPALIAELKTAYRTPTLQNDRRSVVLRVIDEGLLREGTSVRVVDEIFGTTCAKEERGVCEVELMRGVQGSWRLYVWIDGERDAGKIVCYSFTNYHPKG
jgi:hypothetical protein